MSEIESKQAENSKELPSEKSGFLELGISEETCKILLEKEIKTPTLVQKNAIPCILKNKTTVFQSETGSGKTLCFLLPAKEKNLRTIVLAPTAELCSQIKAQSLLLNLSGALFMGGSPIHRQIESLKTKPMVLVGTPSRILELVHLKKIKPKDFDFFVLDEIDRLFSKEMKSESAELLQTFKDAKIAACSATVGKKCVSILSDTLGEIVKLIKIEQSEVLRNRIFHIAIFAERRDKIETLRKFLVAEKPQKTLIFTSKAFDAENITAKLKYKNIECDCIHAKSNKMQRKSVIDRFRSGKLKILVTSDLSSRGLDIPQISHVIQMDILDDSDFFVHRAGRTARAGKNGVNVAIGDALEMQRLSKIEKKLKIAINPRELRNGKLVKPNFQIQDSEGSEAVSE